jgi:hypothetical protein
MQVGAGGSKKGTNTTGWIATERGQRHNLNYQVAFKFSYELHAQSERFPLLFSSTYNVHQFSISSILLLILDIHYRIYHRTHAVCLSVVHFPLGPVLEPSYIQWDKEI